MVLINNSNNDRNNKTHHLLLVCCRCCTSPILYLDYFIYSFRSPSEGQVAVPIL